MKKKYSEAINEAHRQLLRSDKNVYIIGQYVNSPSRIFSTTENLLEDFGKQRVIETPISELSASGIAIGSAMLGLKPILTFPKMDFMYLAMDQLFNHAASWYYMFGGKQNIPLTVRACVSRGYGQGVQHSQSPYSIYAHIPGLKIVCPTNPYDAKGLFISAVNDSNPVIYMDDAWLYDIKGDVPEKMYEVPIGKAAICREGTMITILGISYLLQEALLAAVDLEKEGIDVEIIDPRSIKPFDFKTLLKSIKKTGRLLILDPDYHYCNMGAYISHVTMDNAFNYLKSPPKCISFPDIPIPSAPTLENAYYPKKDNIINEVKKMLAK